MITLFWQPNTKAVSVRPAKYHAFELDFCPFFTIFLPFMAQYGIDDKT